MQLSMIDADLFAFNFSKILKYNQIVLINTLGFFVNYFQIKISWLSLHNWSILSHQQLDKFTKISYLWIQYLEFLEYIKKIMHYYY
jgi:hypothetical protein